jgi:hypothetical protein
MCITLIPRSIFCKEVITALGKTIRLMTEVDGVIDVNGGWPGSNAPGLGL